MKSMKTLIFVLAALTQVNAWADAVIFSGNDVKTLKPNIDLNGQGKILSGSTDPTASAVSAPVGSVYLNTSNGNLYRKVDAGSSTNWQKVGSAAVAGNLLGNPDWETGTTGWTASGGTYTRTTTAANVAFGAGSASWDASAASQTLTSTAVAIPTGLYAANGLARCSVKTAATDYVMQAYDGTNVLASATVRSGSQYSTQSVNFIFPSSGNIQIRVVSASDAAVIYLDDCYLGSAANLTNVSQAEFYGSMRSVSASTCAWSSTTTTANTWQEFAVSGGPCSYTTTGKVELPASGNPLGVRLRNVPPGSYMFVVTGQGGPGGTSSPYFYWALSNGSTRLTEQGAYFPVANSTYPAISYKSSWQTTTSVSDVTFKLQGLTTGSNGFFINGGSAGSAGTGTFEILVYRFPTTSELALMPEAQAWRVDANISGGDPSLGTATVSSYTGVENGTLSLTQNSGSIATQIPCSSTNAPSGTTCAAGNESVGVSFVLPAAGQVRACVSFSHYLNLVDGGADPTILASFQIVETPNNAQTILQSGPEIAQGGKVAGAGAVNDASYIPYRLCSILNMSSAGQKTLRLFYRQAVFGSVAGGSSSEISATSSVNNGIHWTVEPAITPQQLQIANQVQTSNSGGDNIERVRVASACTSTPCAIASQSGGVSSVSRASTGIYTINFTAGRFSAAPSCAFGIEDGSATEIRSTTAPTTLAVDVRTYNSSFAAVDSGFSAICMGPR